LQSRKEEAGETGLQDKPDDRIEKRNPKPETNPKSEKSFFCRLSPSPVPPGLKILLIL